MKTPSPQIIFKGIFFLTATIYFALYSSPHNLRFHVEGVVGFCIKNLSRQWELAGLPVDKKRPLHMNAFLLSAQIL